MLLALVGTLALVGLALVAIPPDPRALSGRRTVQALAAARAALLGYAVADPNRPGELPCPDADGDGRSAPPQDYLGAGCRTLRGWLPWYTLRLPDLRDGSGERLWYALSPTFRAGGREPLNSDTPGTLDLDGAGDLVAVVLAPGAALAGQDRSRLGVGAEEALAQFLDWPNAGPDRSGLTTRAPGGNDRAVGITRLELMGAVETRVLGEVARALAEYGRRAAAGGRDSFPWLLPGAEPGAGAPVPGSRRGRLPFHTPGGEFATDFTVASWRVEGARVEAGGTVQPAALTSGGGHAITAVAGGGRCTWDGLEALACRGSASSTCAPGVTDCRLPVGVARREWRFDLSFRGEAALHPPMATGNGARDVRLAGGNLEPSPAPAIAVTDYGLDGRRLGWGGLSVPADGRRAGARGATGSFDVRGLAWYPDLPAWVPANGWDRYLHVVLAPGATPGGAGPCRVTRDCLVVLDRASGVGRADVPALALLGGRALLAPDRAGTGCAEGLCGLFEGENADGDDRFAQGRVGALFNDRLRVLAALP